MSWAPSPSPQVEARSNAIARGLAGYGVGPGDGVAILCRNHRWFVEASLACAKLGANTIYLNTSFAGPQVSEVMARESSKAIIYDEEFSATVAPAGSSRPASWPGRSRTRVRPARLIRLR